MRARLLLSTSDLNLQRSVLKTLLLIGLRLVDDLLRHKNLLDNLPSRRDVVVQQNTNGKAPAHPKHHDRHDNGHHTHALSLLAGLVARHIELRNQGQDGEQDQANQRRQCNHKAIGKGSARRGGQVGQDVEERERAVVKVLRQVAQQCKQGEQDRHLNQQRQTASFLKYCLR